MKDYNEETIWGRLTAALFKPRKMQDERIFTANVMARIRELQLADAFWKPFARWALPTLALSMGGFIFALTHYSESQVQTVSSEAVVLADQDTDDSVEWLVSAGADETDEQAVNS